MKKTPEGRSGGEVDIGEVRCAFGFEHRRFRTSRKPAELPQSVREGGGITTFLRGISLHHTDADSEARVRVSCPKWQCWVAIGLLLLSGGSAAAQSMHDPHTGLGVAPPAGYSARAAPSRSRYSAVIDVKRENDHDTGCKLGFQPVPQNRNYSQSEINTLAMKPERQSIIEAILGTLYQVSAIDAVEHQGVHGAVATATLKQLPGLPTRAGEMVSLFYLLETPAGRTMLVCVAERQNLQARRREFDAVLQGVTLPR